MGRYDIEKSLSFYLFSKPGFNEGMGRILDMGATLDSYNENLTGAQADYKALLADWITVGNDIKNSIHQYERESAATSKAK